MSDRPNDAGLPTSAPVRKFAPVPIETSSRSSKRTQNGNKEESTQPGVTLPHKTSERPDGATQRPRRFLPEPVETSSKSSRRKLPQPVETSTSRRAGDAKPSEAQKQGGQPKRRFLPQPMETIPRQRGGRGTRNFDDEDEEMVDAPSRQSSSGSSSSSIRKFAPELVETVKGSFRKRTPQGTPETPRSPTRNEHAYNTPQKSPRTPKLAVPQVHESRFSAANIAKRQEKKEKRHSFMVPDLPSIASNSSEESAHSSGSTSPSNISADVAGKGKKASGDDAFSGYLLDIAARVVERQLRDQALAAFPNERFNQPVDHYALEEEAEDPSGPGHFSAQGGTHISKFRRDSEADLNLELSKMREHHDELERAEEEIRQRALATGESKFSAAALASKKGMSIIKHDKREAGPAKAIGQWQKGVGLAQMRNAASPPMLGDEIKFPFSISPKTTRCDPDQAPIPRNYEDDEDVEMADQNLWTAKVSIQNDSASGLWMGTCAQNSRANTPTISESIRRSGLMTPAVEKDDPFNTAVAKDQFPGMHQLPLTPLSSRAADQGADPSMDNMDRMLKLEEAIDEEFNDAFITQIYNYLSLGYPSLAHLFDHELSKISRMPVEELRKDDLRVDAKGYVGAPEGTGLEEKDVAEGKCARWTALRLYVREWARQQPLMAERYPENWGARVRRGSWAI